MHTRFRRAGLATVATALLLTASACGNDNSDDATSDATVPEEQADLSGSIAISGSSTVEPISIAVREAFVAQADGVDVTVEGPGTGDGFELFCGGETDIADASRPINEEELAACESGGVEFIELEIGLDGIAVITAEDNPVECLSFADLYALFGPESEGFATWADAQDLATELGSETELPDENLVITAPGEESGTYDSFIEIALGDIAEAQLEAGAIEEDVAESLRADYSANANDNTIVEGVSAEAGGLGFVGFAFADQAEGVKLMPIAAEAGGDCVEPTLESIQDGSYPISRSLYIYVNAAKVDENEALGPFVDFYLEGLTGFVEGTDYVALDDQGPTDTLWADKTTGTQVEAG